MSRKDKAVAKLIASLGVVSLVVCFGASRIGAEVTAGTFTAAQYSGRYVCLASTGPAANNATTGFQGAFASAVIKIKPNGSGGYDSTSILSANDSAFGGSGTSFCSYTLGTGSFYTIAGDGTGFEKLIWNASSANETVCPGTFTDLRDIALRNLTNNNGVVVDVEFASDNLFGDTTAHGASAGNGYCLK